jgi:hypothetical protein
MEKEAAYHYFAFALWPLLTRARRAFTIDPIGRGDSIRLPSSQPIYAWPGQVTPTLITGP